MADVSHLDHPSLYRAIRTRSWLTQWSAAFKLRAPSDQRPAEIGLSVILSADCSKLVCHAEQSRCFGELVVETLAVTSRWRVELDDPEDVTHYPNHANILGLPLHGSDDLAIEETASALADMVTSLQNRPS